MSEYVLVVSLAGFPPEYVHGMEAGMIWERLKSMRQPHDEVIHDENTDVVRRMAKALKYDVEFEKTSIEGWTNATLTPLPDRPKLEVVK